MIKNGRQAATSIDGIREDHQLRYALACATAEGAGVSIAADLGTGTGYGAWMMAQSGMDVTAFELDQSAIDFGEQHYQHPNLIRICADVCGLKLPSETELITAFEILEHIERPGELLAHAASIGSWLVASVPNEDVVPFETSKHRQHVRHYTPNQFAQLLEDAGWQVQDLGCQVSKRGDDAKVRWDTTDGRTLVAVARAA